MLHKLKNAQSLSCFLYIWCIGLSQNWHAFSQFLNALRNFEISQIHKLQGSYTYKFLRERIFHYTAFSRVSTHERLKFTGQKTGGHLHEEAISMYTHEP